MKQALKEIFVPALRSAGFKGSLPHFRRVQEDQIDLITVQFDKWGGGFVLEISKCSPESFTTSWGKYIAPNKVTAHDLHPDQRFRLQPSQLPGTEGWFRFENASVTELAQLAAAYIKSAEEWWSGANT